MSRNSSFQNEDLLPSLTELALDLHWSWSHATDKVWKLLDPVLWELTHNPLVVLQTVSHDRIQQALADPIVREVVEELIQVKRQSSLAPAWFQKTHPNASLSAIAFFSMEFMLSEALPIYSGGLGNVAGDHLKTASDLGVPLVGVGLLYQQGYARQMILRDGSQQYLFPYNDPGQLPITPLRHPGGEWLRIEVKLPGYSVWLRTWQVEVGRVKLYLLDTNDTANFPAHRGIASELYGGGELRLMQELILGIGGWRLLKSLGLKPEVCHLNEGHTAFVVLERAMDFMEENNTTFEEALTITRSGNVFTTHTAIGAGFDRFSPSLIEQYLGNYIISGLKIPLSDFLALGRQHADDPAEDFNTALLAIRGSGWVNGVSRLHGKVSRRLFAPLFPRWTIDEVPVTHITNGVHMPTWDSPEADRFWTEACGKDRWLGTLETLEHRIRNVSSARLWELRSVGQEAFIEYIRKRYTRQLAAGGAKLKELEEARHLFDPDILTLGFARRFVSYKRPNLLLYNPDRLKRILTSKERPVQLILAGKAHPGDKAAQVMIEEWIRFTRQPELKDSVIFLSDYDMLLTEHMVQGVDLWINTPRHPWEACGTSGMKVLVNGGLNLSELDGWWEEAYSPEVGWAIGDRREHGEDPGWDATEAEKLYDLLEGEIIPEFYSRNEEGIPVSWVNRIRESMARLTPRFSSNRSVREYTETYYIPAADTYRKRAAGGGALGKQITGWKRWFTGQWQKVHFGKLTIESDEARHRFTVEVFLNGLQPGDIYVELYAEGVNGNKPVKQPMESVRNLPSEGGAAVYMATVSSDRPAGHFTPRILPCNSNISIPLECAHILWR